MPRHVAHPGPQHDHQGDRGEAAHQRDLDRDEAADPVVGLERALVLATESLLLARLLDERPDHARADPRFFDQRG